MFCASEASMGETSQPSSSSSSSASASAVRLGGRAIDRHNPIIRDGRRFTPPPSPGPKSSSHHQTQKSKLGLDSGGGGHQEESREQNYATKKKKKKNKNGVATPQGSSRYLLDDPVFFDGLVDSDPVPVPIDPVFSDSDPVPLPIDPVFSDGFVDSDPVDDGPEKIEPALGCYNEDRLIINASKYLSSSFLEKKQPDFFDGFLDYDPVLSPDNQVSDPPKSSPSESCREDRHVTTTTPNDRSSPLPPEKKPSSDQVVVLRVSLHCKGCAGKVRKHISRMKGVTSFNVDFAAKKVTVTGDVTPLGVLASVSKVKNAQFWPDAKK